MVEGIFGLIGVLIGAIISWVNSYWLSKRDADKNAKYLAIRIVCILNDYIEKCIDVVKDDGLCDGQPGADGCLSPQVKSPGPPIFPNDVDWKSIDHKLMYRLLSFPSQVSDGDRIISSTWVFAGPPDFEEWFDERKFQYSQFGLLAYKLSNDLSDAYGIEKKKFQGWNPVDELKSVLTNASKSKGLEPNEFEEITKRIF